MSPEFHIGAFIKGTIPSSFLSFHNSCFTRRMPLEGNTWDLYSRCCAVVSESIILRTDSYGPSPQVTQKQFAEL